MVIENILRTQITCTIENLFENKGYSHEEIRLKDFKNLLMKYYQNSRSYFFNEDTTSYPIKEEEDVIVLPYKPDGVEWIYRQFSIQSLTDHQSIKIEKAFAIVGHSFLSRSGKTYKKVISKLRMDTKTNSDQKISIILPESITSEEIKYKFNTDPKNIYVLMFLLSNGRWYACQPITNRSFKHYTQRTKNNLFQYYEKDNKIGMLHYHYKAIMNSNINHSYFNDDNNIDSSNKNNSNNMNNTNNNSEERMMNTTLSTSSSLNKAKREEYFNKNPIYNLDIYELDTKRLTIENKNDLPNPSTDFLINVLKLMKSYKEKK